MNRREFIKKGAAAAIGVGVASAIEIPILENAVQTSNNKTNQSQSQVLQGQQVFYDKRNSPTSANKLGNSVTLLPLRTKAESSMWMFLFLQ